MIRRRELTAPMMAVRTAVILFVFVIVFTGVLAGAYLWTKPALEASAAEEKMKLVNEVLPPGSYDNDLLADAITLAAEPLLGIDDSSQLYRARRQGAPVAAVFEAVAPDGYSGRIRLLIAAAHDGRILGVRVIQHKETPGLGDYIEPKKDKNKERPWISQFTGLSYQSLAAPAWRVKKDGGHFDYLAGATVTPRAIVKAVAKAARFAADRRALIYGEESTAGAAGAENQGESK